jgi:parallel beta-helix repeat protein
MKDLKSSQSNQRSGALRLCITVGLAALFLTVLLCGLSSVSTTHADPGILYVDGASGQDIPTCGTTGSPCETISYTLNSRASGGDTIRVVQGVYTENLTVDKQVTLEGGYESVGWTRNISQYETIIDGSNSRTVDGDWDGSGVHMSIVIPDGGMYKMWYWGQGLASRGIGLATSSDSIAWTKYAGNPVFTATVDWEEGDVGHPHVIKDGAVYKMWYGPNDERIGYAWSSDGIDWTKYANNPILEGTPGTWDEDGVGAPFVIKVGPSDYRMWYWSSGQIGYVTSTNGIAWTKYVSPVLSPGPGGAWDDESVTDHNVLFDGVTYHMWYAGNDGDSWRIGYASSSDGVNWNKSASNPLLSLGTPGEWDESSVSEPNVLFDGALYRMWFSGWRHDGWVPQRGYATSPNNITWTKYANNPVLSPGTPHQWGQPVAAFVEGSDGSVLDGFTVRNGEAEHGGGVLIDGTEVIMRNCTVVSNTAQYGGGGVGLVDAYATFAANVISSNAVRGGSGGGILADSTVVTVTNNVIALNEGLSMAWDGDGVCVCGDDSDARIINNTVVSNSAEGIQVFDAGTVLVRNNIIYGNDGGIHNRHSGPAVTSDHNAFWNNGWDYLNVTPGTGDISEDPLFVDATSGDYHLQADSPCINAGTATGAPLTDIEGALRDAQPDMGAYEWGKYRIFLPLALRNVGQ